jgi:hypothetical protein
MTSYVYTQSEPGLYTVGFYAPDDDGWNAESDHRTAEEAAARVHYLNGGGTIEFDRLIEELRTAWREIVSAVSAVRGGHR